jgi:putative SOS response-associated peptidase YedK
MCGRYTITVPAEQLALHFDAKVPSELTAPRYNAAPSQMLPVILNEAPDEIAVVRWGLIPHWSKDDSAAYKMINARAETLTERPAYREPLRKRRCLVLADGFFEWKSSEGTGKQKGKTPYRFVLKSREPFAFAGLWENWKNPQGEWVRTFTIVTGAANDLVAQVHNRMPILLLPEAQKVWLDDSADEAVWTDLLRPYPTDLMEAYPVSSRVNAVSNDDPSLVEPLTA